MQRHAANADYRAALWPVAAGHVNAPNFGGLRDLRDGVFRQEWVICIRLTPVTLLLAA